MQPPSLPHASLQPRSNEMPCITTPLTCADKGCDSTPQEKKFQVREQCPARGADVPPKVCIRGGICSFPPANQELSAASDLMICSAIRPNPPTFSLTRHSGSGATHAHSTASRKICHVISFGKRLDHLDMRERDGGNGSMGSFRSHVFFNACKAPSSCFDCRSEC